MESGCVPLKALIEKEMRILDPVPLKALTEEELKALTEEEMRILDPSWKPGDPRTCDRWRDLFRNSSLDISILSTGQAREEFLVDARVPTIVGRHTDVLAPTYHAGQNLASLRTKLAVRKTRLLREICNVGVNRGTSTHSRTQTTGESNSQAHTPRTSSHYSMVYSRRRGRSRSFGNSVGDCLP